VVILNFKKTFSFEIASKLIFYPSPYFGPEFSKYYLLTITGTATATHSPNFNLIAQTVETEDWYLCRTYSGPPESALNEKLDFDTLAS
jgi:hypothetical protein